MIFILIVDHDFDLCIELDRKLILFSILIRILTLILICLLISILILILIWILILILIWKLILTLICVLILVLLMILILMWLENQSAGNGTQHSILVGNLALVSKIVLHWSSSHMSQSITARFGTFYKVSFFNPCFCKLKLFFFLIGVCSPEEGHNTLTEKSCSTNQLLSEPPMHTK